MTQALKNRLREMALEAGAVAVGFAPAGPVDSATVRLFDDYLARGAHFSMGYMENYREIRLDPRLLFTPAASAGTVISMAFPYYHPDGNPLFSLYAQGADYHKVLRKRLRPLARYITEDTGARCRICVDTAPILERYWAVRAGVGFTGRNRCLIVPGAGSFCFLAEIVTEAVIPPDAPCTLGCGDCMSCVRHCPGGALSTPGGFHASRCLSCLTIEHPGSWPADVPVPTSLIYGCDACQSYCPHNRRPAPGLPEFAPLPALRALTPEALLTLTPDTYTDLFSATPITRCPLSRLLRNASLSNL